MTYYSAVKKVMKFLCKLMKLEKNFILSGITHTQKGEYSMYLLICEVNNNQTKIHRNTDGRYRLRD